MGKHSNCMCTICNVEKYIRAELVLPENQARYRQLVTDNSLLADFPTVLDLVTKFRACKDARDGHSLSDRILVRLLASPVTPDDWDYLEWILILLFTPTAHAVVRHVSCRYQFLAREDLSQLGLTTLIQSGKLSENLKLPALDAKEDRVMVCGSPSMLADTRALLDARGFAMSPHIGEPGDYVIERAFVEK